ncbi:MAG: aminotransferase class I/II-fold pyridoxal phosphate-dependent enzyme [Chlamydiae bacterium]|nr:aminotransferase class I/II-fold pyridoxal phosphate-dependent enzyme [Chlamydiota bacterium]
MLASLDYIEKGSPRIAKSIEQELVDQRNSLKLIASENYSSLRVQLAMGNWLTDKYAEGIPFQRYYAGCQNVDEVESYAQELAKKLFNAESCTVQPHSGCDANLAAYLAILAEVIENSKVKELGKPLMQMSHKEYESVRQDFTKARILGMSLKDGGHLTHGFRNNFSGKLFDAYTYGVDPVTERIHYDALRTLAKEVQPHILVAGYSSYSRKVDFSVMRSIADEVGAVLLVDMAHFSGLVAGKVFEEVYDPVAYADVVTSTTHKTLRGPRGGMILSKKRFEEGLKRVCPLAQGGPLEHVIAAKAVAFEEALSKEFQQYAHRIVENAETLARHFLDEGVRVITGGTENHLLVLDVFSSFGLTGKEAEERLYKSGIIVNKNAIPNDSRGVVQTSGIRLGTPAITTLNMGVQEMLEVANFIVRCLKGGDPAKIKADVQRLKARYPLYKGISLGKLCHTN